MLRRVLLPLLSPAIVSSLLIVFALSIDDFVVTSYLAKGSDTETVPIKLYSAARGAPTPALNALASIMVVVTLVSLALAYFVYKRFARGTGGSALESVGGGI